MSRDNWMRQDWQFSKQILCVVGEDELVLLKEPNRFLNDPTLGNKMILMWMKLDGKTWRPIGNCWIEGLVVRCWAGKHNVLVQTSSYENGRRLEKFGLWDGSSTLEMREDTLNNLTIHRIETWLPNFAKVPQRSTYAQVTRETDRRLDGRVCWIRTLEEESNVVVVGYDAELDVLFQTRIVGSTKPLYWAEMAGGSCIIFRSDFARVSKYRVMETGLELIWRESLRARRLFPDIDTDQEIKWAIDHGLQSVSKNSQSPPWYWMMTEDEYFLVDMSEVPAEYIQDTYRPLRVLVRRSREQFNSSHFRGQFVCDPMSGDVEDEIGGGCWPLGIPLDDGNSFWQSDNTFFVWSEEQQPKGWRTTVSKWTRITGDTLEQRCIRKRVQEWMQSLPDEQSRAIALAEFWSLASPKTEDERSRGVVAIRYGNSIDVRD